MIDRPQHRESVAVQEPMRLKRKIAAILAADVAGYSRLVAEDEEETLRRLAAYREVFDDFVRKAGGRIFNTAGDSVMCEFESAVEATRCAIDIQESLRTRNLAYPPNRRLTFRIGITIGDVVERNGDLLGDGVNIAARLEGLAEPGGICVSRSVHEAVANKISVPFRDIGEREVKNIPQPVHAFVVAWPRAAAGKDGTRAAAAPRRWRGAAITAGAAVLAAGVAGVLWLRPVPEKPAPSPSAAEQAADAGTAPLQPAPATPAEAFAALSRQGGIVAEAKTAPELYHNARLYEARGDALAARRAYLALARLGQEFVDPHLRLSALLRVQDGRAGAREVYSELMRSAPARIVEIVHALQFDDAERRAKVEAFAAAHPDYAPAQYLLSEEYSEDRLGSQTLADRRSEYEALSAFLQAEREGRLVPYFLDQSVLAQWLDRARRRQAALAAYFRNATLEPTAGFMRSNTGWVVTLSLPEAATAIAYRIGEAGAFKSTGTTPALDPRTGRPVPMPSFELPADQGQTRLFVRYEDTKGRAAGPFEIAFDPRAALLMSQRDILERMPGAWVAFRADRDTLLYFTHLVSYRCAIDRVVIGFDGGALDTLVPLPPCDETNPHAVPADVAPYRTIPASVQTVSVQLTYFDGSQSEVRTFRRP
ncbi:adenylate/guanylate cyclase domain-containing protein [Chelatococcus sp. SYSU_G07232]|uniref:Adenylate/guanylate cyclase domain-containing protein n=1 Tax=Chelatococcus albus TaxID=3047466 RepID=A0ABT7AJH8_9HYPH|nr:adenylate/guanylate cyclase domain-containing protein [Chelatococcus sp. SYSU_G07232]MDJ1159530.1 adenylate/guanylate cyclase domain-containing protein [Chelatococcus sp. SYSU_G07232]